MPINVPSTEDIVGVVDRLPYDELVYIHRMTGLRLLIAAYSARTPPTGEDDQQGGHLQEGTPSRRG